MIFWFLYKKNVKVICCVLLLFSLGIDLSAVKSVGAKGNTFSMAEARVDEAEKGRMAENSKSIEKMRRMAEASGEAASGQACTSSPKVTLPPLVTSSPKVTLPPLVTSSPKVTLPPLVTSSPKVTLKPLESATASPKASSSSSPKKENDDFKAKKLSVAKNIKIKCNSNSKCVLSWDSKTRVDGYIIFRDINSSNKYKRISFVSKKKFVDKDVKKGKRYSYKIKSFCYKKAGIGIKKIKKAGKKELKSMIKISKAGKKVSAFVAFYEAPKIGIKKEKNSDKYYLKVIFKEFKGDRMEIFLKKPKGIFVKLPLYSSRLADYDNEPLFSYTRKGTKVKIKARTFSIKNKKKRYSAFSRVYQLKL